MVQRSVRKYLQKRKLQKVVYTAATHEGMRDDRVRYYSLHEMLTTEESYVHNLRICDEVVFGMMLAFAKASPRPLSLEEVYAVAQNWSLIRHTHERFLQALKAYFRAWPNHTESIGDLFLQYAPKICTLYKKYVVTFDVSAATVNVLNKRQVRNRLSFLSLLNAKNDPVSACRFD